MKRRRLGELLVEEGKLGKEGLRRALELQQQFGGRLGTNLLDLGLIEEGALLAALGRQRSVQTVSAEELREIPIELLRLVPRKLAARHSILPVRRQGGTLLIGGMDPGDALVEDEIGVLTSSLARTVLGLEVRICEALARGYRLPPPERIVAILQRLSRASEEGLEAVAPAEAAVGDDRLDDTSPTIKIRPLPPPAREATPVPSEGEPTAGDSTADPEAASGPEPPLPRQPQSFIELAPEDAALLYGDEPDQPVDRRLVFAGERLQRAEIRDDIADAVLEFCSAHFERRALFIQRQGRIFGWRGEGENVVDEALRAVELSTEEPSVFQQVTRGSGFWLGALGSFPSSEAIAGGLGAPVPSECFVAPITLRSRVVAYLYGDNGVAGVAGAPVSELRRLAAKAGIAFEVHILRNKIRML